MTAQTLHAGDAPRPTPDTPSPTVSPGEARRRLLAMNVDLPLCLNVCEATVAGEVEATRAIAAWAAVAPRCRRGWTLGVMGPTGPALARLAQLGYSLGIGPSVRVMPMPWDADRSVLLEAADAMVALRGGAATRPVVLEAMRRGTAVLSDRRTLETQAAAGDEPGWAIDARDTASISRCLSRLLTDAMMRRELVTQGRRTAAMWDAAPPTAPYAGYTLPAAA